jgi:hypothetical protein
VDEYQSRYRINRFGYTTNISSKKIKKIENNINDLEIIPPIEQFMQNGTSERELNHRFERTISLLNRQIKITSNLQVIPSHLESYPKRYYFWMNKDKYVRGYLTNCSDNCYRQLEISVLFYNKEKVKIVRCIETFLFDVYPKTMKPFIIDTQDIPWEQIDWIDFMVISKKMMFR